MPLDMAKAIVAEGHRAGKPVFAHVSNKQGNRISDSERGRYPGPYYSIDESWGPSFTQRMVAAHMALTPTLTLWDVESKKGNASPADIEKGMAGRPSNWGFLSGRRTSPLRHRRWLHQQFDTSEEFTWMSRAGMSFQEILASLTTNPAQRFGDSTHSGRIAKGFDADLVVLSADPAQDISAFSKVRYTIRDGEIIYAEK